MLQLLKLPSLSSGCIEVYASLVKAAFSLLTTRGGSSVNTSSWSQSLVSSLLQFMFVLKMSHSAFCVSENCFCYNLHVHGIMIPFDHKSKCQFKTSRADPVPASGYLLVPPTGRRPWGRPRTHLRDYISQLGTPQDPPEWALLFTRHSKLETLVFPIETKF